MTRYFISPVLLAMITVACSSSTTTQSGCTTQECIDQLDGTGGGTSASTSTSAAGSTSVIGTTGGSGTIGTTGGNSSINGTGGNGAGTTGGNSTTSTCVPKTTTACTDMATAAVSTQPLSTAQACGTIPDGCGGSVDCGSCTSHGVFDGTTNTDCGQSQSGDIGNQPFTWAQYGLRATSNICGSRCVRAQVNNANVYGNCGTNVWVCPSGIQPSGATCTKTTNTLGGAITTWCCA